VNRVAGMEKMALNNPAERSFGAMTCELQRYGRVGLTNVGGVRQVTINGDLSRGFNSSSSASKRRWAKGEYGIFINSEMK
jgi:hypothetical protein